LKKNWLYFLLAFAAPLAGIFWWVGGLTSVSVETNLVRGPYHYAYLEHSGDYVNLPDKQMEALRQLKAQGIAHGAAITLMQHDPRATAKAKLTAQTGYLVEAGASVREPLKLADIPARPVIVAQLRAHPRLAAGKVYATLLKYLDEHSMKLKLPTLEIYQNSTLTVEMDI
jgi:effector-binding domain-containing protein